MPVIRTFSIYVNKDVRIRGYFSKPKGFREEKGFGKNGSRVQKHNSNQVSIREVRASHAGRSIVYRELYFLRFS